MFENLVARPNHPRAKDFLSLLGFSLTSCPGRRGEASAAFMRALNIAQAGVAPDWSLAAALVRELHTLAAKRLGGKNSTTEADSEPAAIELLIRIFSGQERFLPGTPAHSAAHYLCKFLFSLLSYLLRTPSLPARLVLFL